MMLDYYRGREGSAFLERQIFVLVAGAVALCAIFGDGRVDLTFARWFYDGSLGVFPLTNHWLLKGVLHDAARVVSASAALALVALNVVAWAAPRAGRLHAYRGELLFAAVGTLAAAATVGVLKHYSAHACPWDLAEFGGTAAYHPLLSPHAPASAVRGCFPAAHPLSGYAWLAAGFALYPLSPRLARWWWALAFVVGTLLGAVQVARGAHFPSHVLWSAWVSSAVSVAVLTACTRLPLPARAARPFPAARAVQRSGST